jgi:hypothetical protein
VAAHPAAVTLALLLLRASKAGAIRRAVATIFEPASEHGQRGMDELHQQTVNLLSFQPLPKDVYDAQVAFNMLARYGQKSQPALIPWKPVFRATIRRLPETALRSLRSCCCRRPSFTVTRWLSFWKWEPLVDVPALVAGPGRRSCDDSWRGGRSSQQRECRRTGGHPTQLKPIPRSPMASGCGPPPTISASRL